MKTVLHTVTLFLCLVSPILSRQIPDLSELGSNWLYYPYNAFVDSERRILYVSDTYHHRVLVWHNIDSLTDTTPPDVFLGQPDNTTTTSGCAPNKFYYPAGLRVDSNGRLWVADWYNNRVLWFNDAASLKTNSSADGVLGQIDLHTCIFSKIPSSSVFDYPSGLCLSDSTLFVVDEDFNRILRFDGAVSADFPIANASADGVIGQADFISGGSGTTSFQFDAPFDCDTDSNGIYVSDVDNYRILYFPWSEANKTANGTASFVLGQPDFLNGTGPLPASPQDITDLGPIQTYPGLLFATDYSSDRVLVYSIPPTSNYPSAIDLFGPSTFYSTTPSMGTYGLGLDTVGNALYAVDYDNSRVLRFPFALGATFNSSYLDVSTQFKDRLPQVTISPKGNNGATQSQLQVSVQPSLIEEVGADGTTVIQSVDIPTFGWDISASTSSGSSGSTQHATFQTFLPTGNASLAFTFFLFQSAQSLTSAGVTFTAPANSLKFELTLSNWPFNSTSDSLRMHIPITVSPPVSTQTQQQTSSGISTISISSTASSGAHLTLAVDVLQVGVADGSVVPVTFSFASTGIVGDVETLDLILDVPFFASSFNYDPTILAQGSSPSSGASLFSHSFWNSWLFL